MFRSGFRALPSRALVATGFGYERERRQWQADLVRQVLPEVRDIRRAGAAALDLSWLAAGRLDGYWERDISSWDMAAGILLVREAGGYVTDLDGAEEMLAKGHVLAGNETIHRELLRLLKEAPTAH